MDKNATMVRTRCRALELITKVLLTIFIKCFTNYETISQISFHLILIIHLWKKYYHHSIVLVLSHVWLSVAPWTVTRQAPLSMEFSSQEHWRVLPGPPLGDFPIQGLNACLFCLLHWQADSLPLVPPFLYTRPELQKDYLTCLMWYS